MYVFDFTISKREVGFRLKGILVYFIFGFSGVGIKLA